MNHIFEIKLPVVPSISEYVKNIKYLIMSGTDPDLELKWTRLLNRLEKIVGKRPGDLNGVLFLIGVQELGKGTMNFSKEEKQDLMHIATCKVLSQSGFYELEGLDQEGWPHWKLVKKLPKFDLLEQEQLLKLHVLEYFENEQDIN